MWPTGVARGAMWAAGGVPVRIDRGPVRIDRSARSTDRALLAD